MAAIRSDELLEGAEASGWERNVVEDVDHVSSSDNDSEDSPPIGAFRLFSCGQRGAVALIALVRS